MTAGDAEPNEWNAADYDGEHAFISEYGAEVLELLKPERGERILDLGCGTGHLAARLADHGADVVGVDSAPEMIAEARAEYPRNEYPDLEFVQADARDLEFDGSLGQPFDAVFSNAALHWVPDADQDAVLESVRDALRPGGRFVAELGGRGNVDTIVDALESELEARGLEVRNPWYFPSVGEYASRLERHGFEVRYATLFDRPTALEAGESGLRNWLGMFGDSFFAELSDDERDEVIGAVEERLRPTLYDDEDGDGGWTADYRRLRFRAVRL